MEQPMAGAYGKLRRSRWRDDEWRKLPTDAQWLMMQLLSLPTTDTAGVFPVQINKWAKGSADMTVERVRVAAKALTDIGVIVADHDTEEGLIRHHLRDDDQGDNIFKGALNRAVQAQSPLLRRILLDDIQNLGRKCGPREQQLIEELRDSLGDEPSSGLR
jgi:hypothetical protein